MFCSRCGANIPDGASFCGNCGAVPEGASVQSTVDTSSYQSQGEFAVKQAAPGKGFAIAGIVCGIIGFVLTIISLVFLSGTMLMFM